MRSARERLPKVERVVAGRAETEMEDEGAADREVVLSREEFEMLQTFHRFVPLPVLTSCILRVYCEDDLQVPEACNTTVETAVEPAMERPSVRGLARHPLRQSGRRMPKKGWKPHVEIDLSAQTPRHIQPTLVSTMQSDSSRRSEGSEEPETRG